MSALSQLNKEWQHWVQDCFKKNIPLETIASKLLENGYINVAIELLKKSNQQVLTPYINIQSNSVKLSDKTVPILFTCVKPVVVILDKFLSQNECQKLIRLADPKLLDSEVIDPQSGSAIKHTNRTSTSTHFKRGQTPLLETIENRIAELIHWPVENGEGLQVLRYEDGGEFKPHYDYFDPALASSDSYLNYAGQRVGTFLMYLSDVESGGATAFPEMNFEIRPKQGMALYFSNVHLDGNIDPKTFHAGVPVSKGVKYLSTKWLREKPYLER